MSMYVFVHILIDLGMMQHILFYVKLLQPQSEYCCHVYFESS